MDEQNSCKTLIGVHLTLYLMHPNLGLATTVDRKYFVLKYFCAQKICRI